MSSCENEARFLHQNEVNLRNRETKWPPTSICSACICTGSPTQTQNYTSCSLDNAVSHCRPQLTTLNMQYRPTIYMFSRLLHSIYKRDTFILLIVTPCQQSQNVAPINGSLLHNLNLLRTVPTIVIAHTFCASRGFLWVVPNNTGIFLCSLKLYEESGT